jgi:peptidyl-prolyl cis-trans isomerase A (cyclophilin A)
VHRLSCLPPLLCLAAMAACTVESLPDGLYAEISTNRGSIVCRLDFEKAPMTVSNFVGLAEGAISAGRPTGTRFYDGLTFHRVVKDFMIQGGDPKGDGTGGPGYEFPNETRPELTHDGPGVLSMANSGPDTNGSQFFITHKATPWLDGGYSIFGRVVKGQQVVDSIQQGDGMKSVKIIRVGRAAKDFIVTQASFDSLVAKAKAALAGKANKAKDEARATIVKKWPKLITTTTGLMFQVLKAGSGAKPAQGVEVTVNYVGKFLDGKVFDASAQGSPAKFKIGQVIEGWNEALRDMKKGEKRLLVIPPELAYGERGYPGAIPPNSYLVFEVELLGF